MWWCWQGNYCPAFETLYPVTFILLLKQIPNTNTHTNLHLIFRSQHIPALVTKGSCCTLVRLLIHTRTPENVTAFWKWRPHLFIFQACEAVPEIQLKSAHPNQHLYPRECQTLFFWWWKDSFQQKYFNIFPQDMVKMIIIYLTCTIHESISGMSYIFTYLVSLMPFWQQAHHKSPEKINALFSFVLINDVSWAL